MNESIILTSYFTLKKHPQHIDPSIIGLHSNGFVRNNDYKYIKPWYESITNLELNGIIFHDNLSQDFIKTYENNYVKFFKVNEPEYSNNDSRFLYYKDYLENNEYENVFLTDCCDVTVASDPNKYIENEILYFCEDNLIVNNYNFAGIRFIDICNTFYKIDNTEYNKIRNLKLLNMGVIGGQYDLIYLFLEKFEHFREACKNKSLNINMTAGNIIARVYFPIVMSGYPFCSRYKAYENRNDVGFIHK